MCGNAVVLWITQGCDDGNNMSLPQAWKNRCFWFRLAPRLRLGTVAVVTSASEGTGPDPAASANPCVEAPTAQAAVADTVPDDVIQLLSDKRLNMCSGLTLHSLTGCAVASFL